MNTQNYKVDSILSSPMPYRSLSIMAVRTFLIAKPELIWVRVTECQDEVFSGLLLDKPLHLHGVSLGSVIQFIVPGGGQYPLLVTPKYLQERSSWRLLTPCTNTA